MHLTANVVIPYMLLTYLPGVVLFGIILGEEGCPLNKYPRLSFTLWIFSCISVPATILLGIYVGLKKLLTWWLWEPLSEWWQSRPKKTKHQHKPTWDDLGRQVEELWRDVEKIGRSL